MARRKLINKLINIKDINEQLVLISESNKDYITPSGKIYTYYGDNMYFPKRSFINKSNGYIYVNIFNKEDKLVQRRLHRLIADAFIDNPNNYNIVMHIDNNKSNNNISNLKWGTTSMNTKQAFDDKLIINDKSFDDSQSMPVAQFDVNKNLINVFGSVSEASNIIKITKGGILCHCRHKIKHPEKAPRCGYYFRFLSEFDKFGFVL